ncbi:PAAR domain-containing protein [Variovorax sp. OV329]|uniref:PAAR domain-containing protein n=1 Tax=Variovorax sp. OV329 TaxID=1882825 RepID=UPI000B8741D7|nr:PAAR domain-containing protein [Variovorax sp. OV329]
MSDLGRIVNSKDGTARGQIYQGDLTSHGGVVIGASGHSSKADGKANARLGDQTFCPRCKPHFFPISTADSTVCDWGVPVPRAGDTTECGAVLIATAAPANVLLAVEALADAETQPYNEQIQLVNTAGHPLSGVTSRSVQLPGFSIRNPTLP